MPLCAACAAVLWCCAAVLWCCAAVLYKYRQILKEILQIQLNSKGNLAAGPLCCCGVVLLCRCAAVVLLSFVDASPISTLSASSSTRRWLFTSQRKPSGQRLMRISIPNSWETRFCAHLISSWSLSSAQHTSEPFLCCCVLCCCSAVSLCCCAAVPLCCCAVVLWCFGAVPLCCCAVELCCCAVQLSRTFQGNLDDTLANPKKF